MNNVGRQQAGIWLWAFMWLLNLIMLNMLIALVMDVYAEVKGSIGSDSETLYSQSIEIVQRWRERRAGRLISLQAILAVLDPQSLINDDDDCSKEGDYHTLSSITNTVPKLREEQATGILEEALKMWKESSQVSPSQKESIQEIHMLSSKVANLDECFERLILLNNQSTGVLTQSLQAADEKVASWDESRPESRESREETAILERGQIFTRAADHRITESLRRDQANHFERLESRLSKMEAILGKLIPHGPPPPLTWRAPVKL